MKILELTEPIYFEWDKANKDKNWLKHTVTIQDVETIFYDKKKLILDDIKHSEHEKRYILFGKNRHKKVLFIVFTMRANKVRVISARRANKKEVIFYEKAITIT